MLVQLLARARGVLGLFYPEDADKPLTINPKGDLSVAQALPELTEIVRMGDTWQAQLAAGLAALTALPTVTAGLSLYNGEDAGSNLCYAIESFGSAEEVIDATQADTTALFAMNNTTPLQTAVPAATAGITVRGTSGNAYSGKARLVSGLTVVNEGWFPHGAEAQSPMAPAVAGANWKVNEARVKGLYLVKPGGAFSVQAVKAAAAAAAQQFFFVRFHTVKLLAK